MVVSGAASATDISQSHNSVSFPTAGACHDPCPVTLSSLKNLSPGVVDLGSRKRSIVNVDQEISAGEFLGLNLYESF